MAKRSVVAYAILLLLFLLAISEIAMVKGKLCEKISKTFSGACFNIMCDKKCISWEQALHGTCHKRNTFKRSCYCYFDCAKKPPGAVPAPPPGTPPSDGGSPPPADGGGGGGSPPPADGGGGGSPPPADGGGGGSPPPSLLLS